MKAVKGLKHSECVELSRNIPKEFYLKHIPTQIIRSRLTILFAILFSLFASSSFAADRITFIYGSFYRSIDVSELEELVETGEASGLMGAVLELGKIDKSSIRDLLTKEHDLSVRKISSLMSSPFGRALLRKFGKSIFPRRSRTNGDKALSSAVTLSVADDDTLQVIEIFRHYPTDVGVDLVELKKLVEDLAGKAIK
jgi:hypothetical protein